MKVKYSYDVIYGSGERGRIDSYYRLGAYAAAQQANAYNFNPELAIKKVALPGLTNVWLVVP